MSWKNVLVVRPQPGQAVTCGVKLRSSRACRICWHTITSSVRSPLGSGRERRADGIADAFLQQHADGGGGGDDALRAQAGFGQSQVQRVIALGREHAVDADQVLHAADLGAQDDLVAAQAVLLGRLGGFDGADHESRAA